MQILNATSPAVQQFIKAWHGNGRPSFERQFTNLNYDTNERKTATDGRRWIDCANDGSATYLIDRVRGEVWTVKGRGRPGYLLGTIEHATANLERATATYAGVK